MRDSLLGLLSRLVSMKTVNDPVRGERPGMEASGFIRDWLASAGLNAEVIESDGYYSVLASTGGEPCVMFMAHYDVVPPGPGWVTDPFTLVVKEGRAYGRGVADDKGNVAALMLAAEEVAGRELGCGTLFAFTGDEEIGGRNGAYVIAGILEGRGEVPRYLINADGTGASPIIRRRKGFKAVVRVEREEVLAKGSVEAAEFRALYPLTQHSHAAYFLPGVDTHPIIWASAFVRERRVAAVSLRGDFIKGNVVPPRAVLEYVGGGDGEAVADAGLTRLLRAVYPLVRAPVRTEVFSEYGVSITPNMYSFDGRVHELGLDVRAMSSKVAVEEALREVLEAMLPGARLEVVTGPGKYLNTPPTARLVREALRVLKEEGFSPEPVEGAGASDSRYFTGFVAEAIDIGPVGGNVHGPNEWVDIASLERLVRVYVKLAERLTQ